MQEKVLHPTEKEVKVILDMTGVAFMSSAGLRMLVVLYRAIKGRGGKILLVGLSEDLQSTMTLTGFFNLFQHYPTLEAGVAALGEKP